MPDWQVVFEPIKIGSLIAKNRIEVAPTVMGLANADQSVSRELIEFHRAHAKGGAAIVTVGESAIDKDRAINQAGQINLGDERVIPGLSNLAEAIKRNGALASIQLQHAGRMAIRELNGGRNPIGPSGAFGKFTEDRRRGEVEVEEMTLEMMDQVIENYATAAFRAKQAGFDMVMVHGGHGWLLSQFISPAANHRTDEYGGSIQNRARFPQRVVRAVKARCGQDFPVEYRFSATDLVPGGLELEEAIEFAKLMQDDVDLFQVSSGMISDPRTYPYTLVADYLPYGENAERTAEIKRVVEKPVAVIGAIPYLEFGGNLIAEGVCDVVAMCRPFIADPAAPKKTARGLSKDVRPCLRCNECTMRVGHILPGRCSVNPIAGQDDYYRSFPASSQKKKVVVVGGGPAGMEAALVASSRGHDVVLFEEQSSLGGNLATYAPLPFKLDAKRYLDYLTKQVGDSQVKVRLGTRADEGLVAAEAPDELIIAVGAEPSWPPIPGLNPDRAVWAGDVVAGRRPTGGKVVVLGGGATGCETALFLAQQGKNVTVVEMLEELAPDFNACNRALLLELLGELRVDLKTRTQVVEVRDGSVTVVGPDGTSQTIAADDLVLALGAKSRTETVARLKGSAEEVHVVGDAVRPRIVYDAVHEGFEAAMEI
jgi:2,4-dienoyl-CoA reductase-like NADH-dependent reductase (Old Yellow Enzyme family)/thioredoxin reductase